MVGKVFISIVVALAIGTLGGCAGLGKGKGKGKGKAPVYEEPAPAPVYKG